MLIEETQMITTETLEEPSASGVSWPAIAAGAVISSAITLTLLSFGIGMGFSVVSPWSAPPSLTSFEIGTGLYFIVMAMLSSAIGGFLAGRLRTKWVGVHANEVYFRDTAHGLLSWAFATLIGAILLSSAASGIINSAGLGVSQAAANATTNSVMSNPNASGPMDRYVDILLRSDNLASAPAAGNSDPRPELTRILTADLRNARDASPADRTYLAKVVAARTGLSEADAQKRVDDVITQAKSDLDQARKALLQMSMWLVASLLLGAFCSTLAATEGGEIRDRNWRTAA
jgi:hypothetical protein